MRHSIYCCEDDIPAHLQTLLHKSESSEGFTVNDFFFFWVEDEKEGIFKILFSILILR